MVSQLDTVLIANRGEIACRVMRTARRLGLRTVAVHSDADRNALHVRSADSAVSLGGLAAADSYLRIAVIVDAALRSGAQAIHPGYGFLSENPEFVEACEAAGLIFIGPSAGAMRAMGLKDAAKRLMVEAGVPVVPGYHGDDQDDQLLAREAAAVGYPVLIKARAGGGGKGMRAVDAADDFAEALAAARREARASFGDDAVLIEKLIASPRHVEVQVFGDGHGNVVHLYERDCSLQRRHQKVIEEAPAPGITDSVRQAMTDAAVRAARAIDYVGAGTIEFIADGRDGLRADGFWFMEMNTRLQVEHPVSEAITGIDLVEWQLRIAAGEPLPLAQSDISLNGHAVEARLYAEDVPAGFLPATGRLDRLRFGAQGRVDTGVSEGDEVLPYYDPMLAKVIAHAPSRREAFAQLDALLADTTVLGTVTNRDFLLNLGRDEHVLAGALDTGLIGRHLDRLIVNVGADEIRQARAVAAVLRVAERSQAAGRSQEAEQTCEAEQSRQTGHTPESVARRLGCWQLWGRPARTVSFSEPGGENDVPILLRVERLADGDWLASDAAGSQRISIVPGVGVVRIDGITRRMAAQTAEGDMWLNLGESVFRLQWPVPGADAGVGQAAGDVVAPMPGRIIEVNCVRGERVSAGQALVTLEAMKMEHTLRAPRDGVVTALRAQPDAQVSQGDVLLQLDD